MNDFCMRNSLEIGFYKTLSSFWPIISNNNNNNIWKWNNEQGTYACETRKWVNDNAKLSIKLHWEQTILEDDKNVKLLGEFWETCWYSPPESAPEKLNSMQNCIEHPWYLNSRTALIYILVMYNISHRYKLQPSRVYYAWHILIATIYYIS